MWHRPRTRKGWTPKGYTATTVTDPRRGRVRRNTASKFKEGTRKGGQRYKARTLREDIQGQTEKESEHHKELQRREDRKEKTGLQDHPRRSTRWAR